MTEPMSIYVPKLEFRDGQWVDGEGGIYTVQFLERGWVITCLNAGYARDRLDLFPEYAQGNATKHRGVGPNS